MSWKLRFGGNGAVVVSELSVGRSGMQQRACDPGADQRESENAGYRLLVGVRSLGRINTKTVMPVSSTTRATTAVMAVV